MGKGSFHDGVKFLIKRKSTLPSLYELYDKILKTFIENDYITLSGRHDIVNKRENLLFKNYDLVDFIYSPENKPDTSQKGIYLFGSIRSIFCEIYSFSVYKL